MVFHKRWKVQNHVGLTSVDHSSGVVAKQGVQGGAVHHGCCDTKESYVQISAVAAMDAIVWHNNEDCSIEADFSQSIDQCIVWMRHTSI
jgi:hypothetical protein